MDHFSRRGARAHFSRFEDWTKSRPIAERMSFSSFSRSVDDIWAHDLYRRYRIALFPGYTPPQTLDRGDRDAMWRDVDEFPLEKAAFVWDGFCPVALFEIIRECFDYDGAGRFVRVIDFGREGSDDPIKTVLDDRDPEILALRPRRQSGWGPRKIRNHIVELWVWSGIFPGGEATGQIYSSMVSSGSGDDQQSRDCYHRAQHFMQLSMFKKDLFEIRKDIIERVDRGSLHLYDGEISHGSWPGEDKARAAEDARVELLDLTYAAISEIPSICMADFPDGAPDSFYRFVTRIGREKKLARRRMYSAPPHVESSPAPIPPTAGKWKFWKK